MFVTSYYDQVPLMSVLLYLKPLYQLIKASYFMQLTGAN